MEFTSRPIRIAYLLSQYPAVNHVFMLREIRALRKLGFDVRVASIRPPDRELSQMTAAEREEVQSTYYVKQSGIFQVSKDHLRTLLARPVSYLRGLFEALRAGSTGLFYFVEAVVVGQWMARNQLLHVHTHYVPAVAKLVAKIFPITFSATFHGPAEFNDPVGSRLAEKIQASLFSCAISQYGRSQLMYAADYQQWPKLEITSLGVDLGEFRPRPPRPSPARFQLISAGRLAPVKGLHVLIEALAILVGQGRDTILRVAGDGPDGEALRQDAERRGVQKCVRFEGNVDQNRLKELYAESDLLVMSSFAEGLPVVLMEAMAMEIACVAPWVNGIPEIITDGSDGLLVPAGDPVALADAIGRLMDDAELRNRLGRKARLKVQAKFDLDRNTQHLADIFRRRLAL